MGKDSNETTNSSDLENHLKSWRRKRDQILATLGRISEYAINFPSDGDISLINVRKPIVFGAFQEFQDVQLKIEENVPLACLPEEETHRAEFENVYFDTIAKLESLTLTVTNPAKSTAISSSISKITLPALKLPEFNGEYSGWISFRDTFKAVIHDNCSLSNVEKLHYLRSTLKGDALRAIESLAPVDANYHVAWNLLNKRFENTRLIVNSHVRNILDIPIIPKATSENLRHFSDALTANLEALKVLEVPVEYWDTILIAIICDKLDYQTKREWQSQLSSALPKLNELLKLIDTRCQVLENAIQSNTSSQNNAKSKQKTTVNHFSGKKTCPVCKRADHKIYTCNDLIKLAVEERYDKIKALKLCLNCLKPNHTVAQCKSNNSCTTCNQKHHTLLHKADVSSGTSQPHVIASTSNHTSQNPSNGPTETLLGTAIVHILDYRGNVQRCRALLDGGSQSNFITKELCEKLKLQPKRTNHIITGVSLSANRVNQMIDVQISSRFNNFNAVVNCLVLDKITQNLPLTSFSTSVLKIPKNIVLADETFNINNKIDLLLGAQVFFQILKDGKFDINSSNTLFVHNTDLGWVIAGGLNIVNFTTISTCNTNVLQDLNDRVSEFLEFEGSSLFNNTPYNKILSPEEIICEQQFIETHKRTVMGNFVVELPIKNDHINLGHSELLSQKRFFNLEKKLEKNPQLKEGYVQFMRDYEKLGHMRRAPNKGYNNSYFLPHHPVIKETSQGIKLRVVFDGSMKSSNSFSLNDNLLTGPNLQQELFIILLKFRTYNYVISADIEKMYRQIFVAEKHQRFQKIFWRENVTDPLRVYQLQTVTYGTGPAPYLAMRCLKQLAMENLDKMPIAATTILNNFYMDDLICGDNTLSGALALRDDIRKILDQGNFKLHKWASNHPTLVPGCDKLVMVNFSNGIETKTLGLMWNCTRDTLKYNFAIENISNRPSKRLILSIISKIFDPLGLITPVTLMAKLILQSLWASRIGWDDLIPKEIDCLWTNFVQNLSDVSHIEIPRKIFSDLELEKIEVHGFADASTKGFGAAIYIKTRPANDKPHIQLLCAKSKVAPVKTISLPRLELSAALLLSRLFNKVIPELKLNIGKCYMWTDSTIVLNWIASSPHNWQTFVANRVAEIQNLTADCIWRHVNSAQNPADLITRGLLPKQLIGCKLWWSGPEYLLNSSNEWPITCVKGNTEILERKQVVSGLNTSFRSDLLTRYSDFNRLQRIISWLKRFVYNCRNKRHNKQKMSNFLQTEELENSHRTILLLVQHESFFNEFKILTANKELPKNNSLLSLNPFVDPQGILRVGGRISNARLTYDKKHQILLPKKHYITELLIRQFHMNYLHAGAQATLSALRQIYWPIAGRDAVRTVLRKCISCFRVKPKINLEKMGELPPQRVEQFRPFLKSGVDLCGPILIKEGRLRKSKPVKAYITLFICLSTKAVHLELISDLTTEGFLNALRRFVSRRGTVKEIHSDNATNFIGCDRKLKQILKNTTNKQQLISNLANINIKWCFIPPRTPNFGGIWEANVKLAKSHIKRTIGDTILTYEEMHTLLTRVEACINSRPLLPLSNDPNDLCPLTPGHFLIGSPITAPVEENLEETKVNRLTRWQHVEKMRQHFWRRWHREYIIQLQQRTKWKTSASSRVKPGTMVLLVEEGTTPLHWPIGRIIETHPGKDGMVRVVTIKTANGVYKRGISKVCALPIED